MNKNDPLTDLATRHNSGDLSTGEYLTQLAMLYARTKDMKFARVVRLRWQRVRAWS